jgi:RNA recognition motif-containing protein
MQEVKEFFNEFTEVKWVNLLKGNNGRNKGIAYVTLNDEKAV